MTVDGAALAKKIAAQAEVRPGGVLIVHSAFRRLGAAGARAEDFIDGLIDYLEGGTLLMPTMSWRTVTPENPVFDELETASHVGVLTEIFRRRVATHRSIHPTHSTAAVGPLAAAMTEGHQVGETPCPPHSPFGRLPGRDADILLLGVGFESCTMLHCPEEVYAPETYLWPREQAVTYPCRDRHGTVHPVFARRHRRLPRDFPKFGPRLAGRGQLRSGNVHETDWQACRARDLSALLTEAFERNTLATLEGID